MTRTNLNYYKAGVLSLMIALISGACQPAKQKNKELQKPNVIVMLLDDAGYADFGFAGCKDLDTPNIDQLATNGIRFSDAHVTASVCGPSRAGLMVGKYQQRFGFECNPPKHYSGINLNEKTIADAMKEAGYKTAAFGKWHLGEGPEYRPNRRGFDYFWGFLTGGRSYFPNKKQDKEGTAHSIRENDKFTTFEGYLTDRLGEKAAEFIGEHKDQPFFIYWAPNAVHTPMEAKEEDMVLYEGHERQTLAAMTWSLDKAVGTIVNKLKSENLLDNTLIFFLSDNGGAHNNQSSNLPLKGFKGNKFEGGHRVPFFVHWPASLEGGQVYDGLTSSLDIFASCVDVAGMPVDESLDGVSLIPYLKGEKQGEPHTELFWRKDKMAAIRSGDHKVIRVSELGYRMYNLKDNLQETNDLVDVDKETFTRLNDELKAWETTTMEPLWTEGEVWDEVTRLIHEDLFMNREVQVKNPGQLAKSRSFSEEK
ncbi:sulfatase-like hydrolase/transferase [Carboxylicivirga sp. RSCT41]|uniref:sulfatase-like hydrolase/transferase n=1 Tax=Carboxylicivirga agarovorans TaxID=3417570 RepID=UPI003D336C00